MNDTVDPDIAAMKLSDGEKWGLQVYRNYSRAFGEHRVKTFVEQASPFEADVTLFKQVVALVASEEHRVVPVIAAAYADERLEEMFKREIPDGVPGGRSALMSGFGPLARLSQRIQMAFAFGWLSKDLLIEFDTSEKYAMTCRTSGTSNYLSEILVNSLRRSRCRSSGSLAMACFCRRASMSRCSQLIGLGFELFGCLDGLPTRHAFGLQPSRRGSRHRKLCMAQMLQ